MAPTEILAEQHFLTFRRLLARCPYRGRASDVGRSRARSGARRSRGSPRGESGVVVGTHALIQEGVRFRRLGLAVVDEQHRFGVLQREDLRPKGYDVDVLVMTATPIPRTLALTAYGDLDMSVVDERPPGRLRPHAGPPRLGAAGGRGARAPGGRGGTPGLRRLSARRRVGEARGRHGRDEMAAEWRRRAAGACGGPAPRPHDERREGEVMAAFAGRRDPGAGRHDRDRGGRRRGQRDGHGHRACRALRPRPAPPASRPRRARGRALHLRPPEPRPALRCGSGAARGHGGDRRRLRDRREGPRDPGARRLLRDPAVGHADLPGEPPAPGSRASSSGRGRGLPPGRGSRRGGTALEPAPRLPREAGAGSAASDWPGSVPCASSPGRGKGRRLQAPRGDATRPTARRVSQTLFDILAAASPAVASSMRSREAGASAWRRSRGARHGRGRSWRARARRDGARAANGAPGRAGGEVQVSSARTRSWLPALARGRALRRHLPRSALREPTSTSRSWSWSGGGPPGPGGSWWPNTSTSAPFRRQ